MTGSGLSVLLIDRLAELLTLVGALAMLGVLGSSLAELAVPLLGCSLFPYTTLFRSSVMSGALVTPRLARVQVTVVVPVQVQPVRLAETTAVPEGLATEVESQLATERPALLTDRV